MTFGDQSFTVTSFIEVVGGKLHVRQKSTLKVVSVFCVTVLTDEHEVSVMITLLPCRESLIGFLKFTVQSKQLR